MIASTTPPRARISGSMMREAVEPIELEPTSKMTSDSSQANRWADPSPIENVVIVASVGSPSSDPITR